MNKLITVNGESYMLDLDRAIGTKCLRKVTEFDKRDLLPGDVFVPQRGVPTNPFLLVQSAYGRDDSWQLMGLGCSPNSDDFHRRLHTLEEIKEYLIEEKMVFAENINREIEKLVYRSISKADETKD